MMLTSPDLVLIGVKKGSIWSPEFWKKFKMEGCLESTQITFWKLGKTFGDEGPFLAAPFCWSCFRDTNSIALLSGLLLLGFETTEAMFSRHWILWFLSWKKYFEITRRFLVEIANKISKHTYNERIRFSYNKRWILSIAVSCIRCEASAIFYLRWGCCMHSRIKIRRYMRNVFWT